MPLSDSSQTCTRAVQPEPSPAVLPDVRRRHLRGLPVLVYEVSRRAWGLRLRRTNKGSRYRHCPCCLPHMLTASASGLYIFAAQSPTPPIPLFTLRRAPRDAQRKTRGQSGSLLLLCKASSSSASYRFSPAHKHPDNAQNPSITLRTPR